ncbi:MAG: hypothetical protein OCD02_18380 [Spirochaetaceae bacterium]
MKNIKYIILIVFILYLTSCFMISGIGTDTPNTNDPNYGELSIESITLSSPDESINLIATYIDDKNYEIVVDKSVLDSETWFLLSISGVYLSLYIEDEEYVQYLNSEDIPSLQNYNDAGYVDISSYHFTENVTTTLDVRLDNHESVSFFPNLKSKYYTVEITVIE